MKPVKVNERVVLTIDSDGDVYFEVRIDDGRVEDFYVFRDELPRLVQVLTESKQVVPDARDVASTIQDILDEPLKHLYATARDGNIGWNQQMELEAELGELERQLVALQARVKEAA
jgi:hypothetical protein